MNLSPAVLLIAVVACLLLALALWMLARAQHKEQNNSVNQHLQRSLQGIQSAPLPGMDTASLQAKTAQTPGDKIELWMEQYLGISAWGMPPKLVLSLGVLGLALALIFIALSGFVAGVLILAIYSLFLTFFIWRRVGSRRKRLLEQLPGFLDNMVRLISIGNSPHAAFQMATTNVPSPLGDALQQATATLSVSPDLGQAMGQLERSWHLPEFGLLAAVFRMSTRYGGRADLVLERVSAYIRDRLSAERELHAMSAEIRLSAWILALLPIVVGGLIMVLNPGYFMRMWNDSSGQKMILIAAGMEAFGAFLLYRLAQLK